MNNLSGEGLFDERPMTQTSLGRFVLLPTRIPSVCPRRAYIELIYIDFDILPARVAKLARNTFRRITSINHNIFTSATSNLGGKVVSTVPKSHAGEP